MIFCGILLQAFIDRCSFTRLVAVAVPLAGPVLYHVKTIHSSQAHHFFEHVLLECHPCSEERLREEEQMESQRLQCIELEEKNLMQETEAELLQMRIARSQVSPAQNETSASLLRDLSRMEEQRDRLQSELTKLSQQLRDQKAEYQEDKGRAQAAMLLKSQKEEVADELEEERNSGARKPKYDRTGGHGRP